jgi:hypothetical protein
MKRIIFKTTAIVLILIGVITSCKKSEDSTIPLLQNVEGSTCLSFSDNIREYIKYVAIDKQTLRFEQFLVLTYCETVETTMIAENKTILVNVCAGKDCNPICPITVNYDITHLQGNNTYSFIFQHCGRDYYSCEITFTENLNETIFITQ